MFALFSGFTVSGVHARIQKQEGKLLVTDLDSTNGTFIDNKRLSAGVVATVPPGSCLTFGTYFNLFFFFLYLLSFDFGNLYICSYQMRQAEHKIPN